MDISDDILTGVYIPVILFPGLRNAGMILRINKRLGYWPYVFSHKSLLYVPSDYCRRIPDCDDVFITAFICDLANCMPGKLLYLIPCTDEAVRIINDNKSLLEQFYVLSGNKPGTHEFPLPQYLTQTRSSDHIS